MAGNPWAKKGVAGEVTSGQAFEIVSTLSYSHGLPPNPVLPDEAPQCHLLQYAIDRLRLAAEEFEWPRVVSLLSHPKVYGALLREIEDHLGWEYADVCSPDKLFVVRLSFDREARLTLMSGQRPRHAVGTLAYPAALPPPGKRAPRKAPIVPVYVDRGAHLAPSSPFARHKTTLRGPYNEARSRVGLYPSTPLTQGEVLLVNAAGEVMDGGFSTLYFWRQDELGLWAWRTPRRESGAKLGVSRRWALEHAGVSEMAVMAAELVDGERIWLSSATGWFVRGFVSFGRHDLDSSSSDSTA
ncbi:hypothetical protein CDD83_7116 [Cordyceps sp. RAO-2017]|nr:hypothetical protein CDD83_7116 [Cordyceps sp. RAO-2017]